MPRPARQLLGEYNGVTPRNSKPKCACFFHHNGPNAQNNVGLLHYPHFIQLPGIEWTKGSRYIFLFIVRLPLLIEVPSSMDKGEHQLRTKTCVRYEAERA